MLKLLRSMVRMNLIFITMKKFTLVLLSELKLQELQSQCIMGAYLKWKRH